MSQWTDAAKARLEEYLARMRQPVAASGADENEVADDLRRHVEEEVAARKLTVVTEQDVAQILAQIGAPEAPPVAPPPSSESPATRPPAKGGLWRGFFTAVLTLFGVLLPLGVVIFEFLTGACAGVLFDPIPTLGHLALVTFVPLANLAVLIATWHGLRGNRSLLDWASGIAIGISLIYALLFLPVAPFAAIGIIFLGFGFIPLSPLLSFISAVALRRRLRIAAGQGIPLPGLWWGMLVGVGALVAFALPTLITQHGLRMAASDSPSESFRGVRWLRAWGQNEELLRACYGRVGRGGDLYSWGPQVNPEAARTIYYRVYGHPFNSVPPPKLYAGRARWSLVEEEFTWDDDQGGDAVAGRVRGLSLATSRQDAVVYPEAALAYVEWTMEFQNDSSLQREARAQIAMPPGAVVSRLTLWIDGEEREAAFGGRSQVKGAYKETVQQRRDPVLVTTCGPDRVLMQCFPVPPNGGKMKLRLGITAPLALTARDTGCLRLPCVAERNFALRETCRHSLWVESSQPLESTGGKLKAEQGKPGIFALRGQLTDPELASPLNVVRAHRPADATKAWTKDTRENDGTVIRQTLGEKAVTPPDRVVMVVDGTKGMEAYYPEIAAALGQLPADTEFALVLARDGFEELVPLQKGGAQQRGETALRRVRSVGGHDSVPALVRAWDLAAGAKSGAIVWVHGPQPVALEAAEELRQRCERSSNPPLLLDVQTLPGPNRVSEKLDGLKSVRPLMRLGKLGEDVAALFKSWASHAGQLAAVRERSTSASAEAQPDGTETSMQLARLWAADEVSRLAAARKATDAMRTAVRYQLVTPVSGAVVLENQSQYERAGLQPSASDTVPIIPEPSAGVLLLLGLMFMAARFRRARQR